MSGPTSLDSRDFEGLRDVLFLTLANDSEQDESVGNGKRAARNHSKISVSFHRNIVTAVIERLCKEISKVCLPV